MYNNAGHLGGTNPQVLSSQCVTDWRATTTSDAYLASYRVRMYGVSDVS